MRTVFCHFRNEAYLLPWWLKHHREIFDHGVLIDYGSTDDSVEIIRELTPHWTVTPTKNKSFNGLDADMEIMCYESEREGWKMALNVTEFLHARDLSEVERRVAREGRPGIFARGVVMADPRRDAPMPPPVYDRPLVAQRHWGFFENTGGGSATFWPWDKVSCDPRRARLYTGWRRWVFCGPRFRVARGRLYHRRRHGGYSPGRHGSFLNAVVATDEILLLWYAYAPDTEENRRRRRATLKATHIDVPGDRVVRERYDKPLRAALRKTRDLSHDPVFAAHTGVGATRPSRRRKL